MLQVGATNMKLVQYLINQLRQSRSNATRRCSSSCLRPVPRTGACRWPASGCRSSSAANRRRLQLGTEVVASKDGSLAALGASPGASTAVTIMLEVLQRCFKDRLASASWQERLQALLPSIGGDPVQDPELLQAMRQRSDALLGLSG